MQYQYAKERPDYSDLTSGRVFYSLPGHPAFPVRLASEIFQRCFMFRQTVYQKSDQCVLYDPCCGTAYHLGVLGYLHGEYIHEIIGSDVDAKVISLAARNLEMLSVSGLDKRINEITIMLKQYGKNSHKDALKSAHILRDKINSLSQQHSLETRVFQSSAMDSVGISRNIHANSVDVVFTDVPYGQHSHWHDAGPGQLSDPLWAMLDALLSVLSSSSVVAVVSNKRQKASHASYRRLEQFQIGKRRVEILSPI